MNPIIVIKVGTGVLTRGDNASLNGESFVRLATEISRLMNSGYRVLLVSSGAVGAGVSLLGLDSYPDSLPAKQGCAAIGQSRLMQVYENLFSMFDLHVAQLLLTAQDFKNRSAHIANTLDWLLANPRIIPIINENDTVAVQELTFGDNDALSVAVAKLAGARHLILLTSVDGLYPGSPKTTQVLREVPDISAVLGFASDSSGKFSLGGMRSKLQAVSSALEDGIPVIIANGNHPERISSLLANSPDAIGTRFPVPGA